MERIKIYNPIEGIVKSMDDVAREFDIKWKFYYVTYEDGEEIQHSSKPDHTEYSECLELNDTCKSKLEFVRHVINSAVKKRRFLDRLLEDI